MMQEAYASCTFSITTQSGRIVKVIWIIKFCRELLLAMIPMGKSKSQLRKDLNPSLACP
jgi:hypothetical protein